MRYPPGIDVTSIIEHALHLKYPHLYPEYEHTPQHTQVSELTPVPPVEEAVQKPKKKSREKKYVPIGKQVASLVGLVGRASTL